MKNVLNLMAFLLLFLSSCNQEENELILKTKTQSLKVVDLVNGMVATDIKTIGKSANATMTLQFNSETDFQNVLNEFESMSTDEKIAFTDALGFVSLEKLLRIADEELDSIGNSAVNEADFAAKYSAYKAKYSRVFMFNASKSDDLSPYIPASTEDDNWAYLVGENHCFVIGESVREIGFSNMMRESDDLLYNKTKESIVGTRTIYVNSFNIQSGSKKTIFDTQIRYEDFGAPGTPKLYKLYYHFGAQKKMWYGWKRDSDRNFAITSRNNNNRYIDNAGGNIDVYSNLYMAGATDAFIELAYVWTDLTLIDANNNFVYDKNNAYQCQINKSYN